MPSKSSSSESFSARGFLVVVCLLGIAALLATLLLPPVAGDHLPLLPVGIALTLAAFAGTRKVYLLHSRQPDELRYVTLGFLVTFGTLLALGIRAGVLAGIVSTLAADLYPRRTQLRYLLFNMASIVTTAWCSGQVFALFNHGVGMVRPGSLPAVFAAMTTYFFLNAGLLAKMISLTSRRSLRILWHKDFMWAFPPHLLGAAYVAFAVMFVSDSRTLLLGAAVVPFALQYYNKLYADHVAETQQLIDKLEAGKKELEAGKEELSELYLSTVKSLATAIAAKDQYTHAHIHRVQHYAVSIAQNMGVSGAELEAIRTGAVLHDIGKLGVPDYVLLKPGRLTPDEFEKMKRHPVVGADILEPVQFPWPVSDVVRHHHEKWDGTGYPDGLAGEAIPLSARILSVADVYDALTSDRPYRTAWPRQKTLDFLITEAGMQFDPQVVRAFLEVVDQVDLTMQELELVTASAEAITGQPSAASTASGVSRQIGHSAWELWVFYEISQKLNLPIPMQWRLTQLVEKLTAIRQGTTCAFFLYDAPPSRVFDTPLPEGLRLPSAWPAQNSAASDNNAALANGNKGDGADETPSEPRLRVYAAAGHNADVLLNHSLLDANAPSAIAARHRRTARGPYNAEGLTWSVSEDDTRPVRSILIVPLLHGEDVLGTMTFYHRDPDAFSADDEHLLTMIAEQVQTALSQEQEYVRAYSNANTDALTGLNNMRYLRQKMDSLLPPHNGRNCALLYLDLDNFKNMNTRFGHPQGSRVLREVAQLLPRELRPTDMAVRYGGDEFVIVLPQSGETGAREVAARIRSAVQNYRPDFLSDFDASCHLDVSIGIACAPHDSGSLEDLIAIADRRMFQTKTEQKQREGRIEREGRTEKEVRCLFSEPLCLDTAVVASVLEKWKVVSSQ